MASSTNKSVCFMAKKINAHVYMPGRSRLSKPSKFFVSTEDNIPVTKNRLKRKISERIDDNTFVAVYTRYFRHFNGTYKIAEVLNRTAYAVHTRALRLRDLGVDLPEAYYDRTRCRINVDNLNLIIQEVLSRRTKRYRRNSA